MLWKNYSNAPSVLTKIVNIKMCHCFNIQRNRVFSVLPIKSLSSVIFSCCQNQLSDMSLYLPSLVKQDMVWCFLKMQKLHIMNTSMYKVIRSWEQHVQFSCMPKIHFQKWVFTYGNWVRLIILVVWHVHYICSISDPFN